MAENRPGTRLYTEKEIGSLIKRATEMQSAARESEDRGLSLQDIEQLAAEIGIEAEHLRNAALELQRQSGVEPRFRLWGGPHELEQERIVEGNLTEGQWEQVVLGLRRLTGSTGTVSEIGRAREWTRSIKDLDYLVEQTQVTLSPRGEQTKISVRKKYRGGAVAAYVISVLLSGTLAGIFLDGGGFSDAVNTLILGGSGLGGLAVARTSIGYWARRQRERLRVLTDWLQEAIAAPESAPVDVSAVIELPEPALVEGAPLPGDATQSPLRT